MKKTQTFRVLFCLCPKEEHGYLIALSKSKHIFNHLPLCKTSTSCINILKRNPFKQPSELREPSSGNDPQVHFGILDQEPCLEQSLFFSLIKEGKYFSFIEL